MPHNITNTVICMPRISEKSSDSAFLYGKGNETFGINLDAVDVVEGIFQKFFEIYLLCVKQCNMKRHDSLKTERLSNF